MPRPLPPPPIVEDEAESLAKEYGSSGSSSDADGEPQSRGEVDQYPVIMDVHEHNPERRFVIVPEGSKDDKDVDSGADSSSLRDKCPRIDVHDDDATGTDPDISRYGLERRRSQQDLPPLDTDFTVKKEPEHHRARSVATGPRPDYFSPRQSRPFGDQLLSPEVMQHGTMGHEKKYHSTKASSSTGEKRRQSSRSNEHDEVGRRADRDRDRDRDRDPIYQYNREGASGARRSYAESEGTRDRQRRSGDFHSPYRKDSAQSKNDNRDEPQVSSRANGASKASVPSPRSSREQSRSGDEYTRSPRSSGQFSSQPKPVVVQNAPSTGRADRLEHSPSARQSRTSTFPLAAAGTKIALDAVRGSKEAEQTTPRPRDYPLAGPKSPPPYPENGPYVSFGLGIKDSEARQLEHGRGPSPATIMPEPVQTPTSGASRSFEAGKATPTIIQDYASSPAWQPPPFDPVKDGHRRELSAVGSYRRYSESKDKQGSDLLPDCPRRKAVAGMVDWLTLPHTDFNICPTCYDGVFAKTAYRSHFKPMLRPTGDALSCDFGCSPWYRIAWLMIRKDDAADLRLMQRVASVSSAPDCEPCPGSKKATRSWRTVRDPQTKRPIPEFAVCHQCARTVELLLPNLTGVFESLDSRSKQDTCALHFTPEREQFVLVFDALETTSDKAFEAKQPPNLNDLAQKLWHSTTGAECREDSPVRDGYWHVMQFLPEFTVCQTCFDDVVKPKLTDGNDIARNFYTKTQRLPSATCQLYSERMREIFRRSCRRNDPKYLEEKVIERRHIEMDIYEKLVKLDRANVKSSWREEQVGKLLDEWKRWE